jgi:hypothetical protein
MMPSPGTKMLLWLPQVMRPSQPTMTAAAANAHIASWRNVHVPRPWTGAVAITGGM